MKIPRIWLVREVGLEDGANSFLTSTTYKKGAFEVVRYLDYKVLKFQLELREMQVEIAITRLTEIIELAQGHSEHALKTLLEIDNAQVKL